jgi:hypothetical protein
MGIHLSISEAAKLLLGQTKEGQSPAAPSSRFLGPTEVDAQGEGGIWMPSIVGHRDVRPPDTAREASDPYNSM